MSNAQTILLGAIAGVTIFLGLPLGRLHTQGVRAKAFLNAVSAGILVFLLFDILAHATDPVEEALTQAKTGEGAWSRFAGLSAVYVTGFAVGLLALFYLGRMWTRTRRALHNFSEGLAIGQAAHSGEISLAALLITGFALHNATEGFGIVGPLGAASVRPSWGWLGLAGLIGGGPTFLGTIVGTSFDSLFVYVGCLALAAGAILYVIGEILPVGRRLSWEVTLWGLLAGVMLGVGTDLVVAVAGG